MIQWDSGLKQWWIDSVSQSYLVPFSSIQEVIELSTVDFIEADPHKEGPSWLGHFKLPEDIFGSQSIQSWILVSSYHGVGLSSTGLSVRKASGIASEGRIICIIYTY